MSGGVSEWEPAKLPHDVQCDSSGFHANWEAILLLNVTRAARGQEPAEPRTEDKVLLPSAVGRGRARPLLSHASLLNPLAMFTWLGLRKAWKPN